MSPGRREAWVTFVADDETSHDAIVLAKSLRITGTNRSIVALIHSNTSSAIRTMMREVFDKLLLLPSERDHPLTSVLTTSAQLYCLSLTCFDKVFFLDSKCMLLQNCDDLFDLDGVVIGYTEDSESDLSVDVCGFETSLELYLDVIKTSWHKNGSVDISCDFLTQPFWSYIILHYPTTFLEKGYTFLLSCKTELPTSYLKELPKIVKVDGNKISIDSKNLQNRCLFEKIISCYNYLSKETTSLYPNPLHLATKKSKQEPIAIIGISCRLPSANNLAEFWNLLLNKQDGIQPLPAGRWTKDQSCIMDEKLRNMQLGFLKCPVDEFDAEFFNISPMELAYTDPQQRLLLEVSYEALEDAAIDPKSLSGSQTGIFNGIWSNEYKELMIESGFKGNEFYRSYMGNAFGTASSRIAHYLGTTGPNITTENGCSSSLVATGIACESLRNGCCDLALVSGCNLILRPFHYDRGQHLFSPSNHCKPFDASADGYARAEGVVVVVLKKLSDAVKNRDSIYAVIRGYAATQEGLTSSMGTPTVTTEALAMQLALENANVDPNEVDFVEAHATGTAVGDPLEFNAIKEVYSVERSDPLIIGAVKSNIGHTESCSGLASLVKTVLALTKELIPPILELKTLNPKLNLESIPAIIPLEAVKWEKSSGRRRIAGISNFGITGTDAHIILEEAPETVNDLYQSEIKHPTHILTLSAKTDSALTELITLYESYFASTADLIEDITYTANTGRAHFNNRIAIIGKDNSEMLYNIRNQIYEHQHSSAEPSQICFLFSGQGSEYHGMGKQFYNTSPVFRQHFDACDDLLQKKYSISIKEALWGGDLQLIHDSLYSPTSVFVIEYCMTKLWESWGVKPDIVVGHSLGEIAAATAAGYFDLQTGIHLVATRTKLICQLPKGKMIAVNKNPNDVSELLGNFLKIYPDAWLDIAAENSSSQTTLAGNEDTIEKMSTYCNDNNIKFKLLSSTHAHHSRHMDAILNEFSETVKLIKYNSPTCKFVSGLTGNLQGNELDKDYWMRHTRETVRFVKASQLLKNLGCKLFIEVGPQSILSTFVTQNLEGISLTCLPSISSRLGDWKTIIQSLSKLYTTGRNSICWSGFYNYQERKKLRLPFYPFQREKYWFSVSPTKTINQINNDEVHPLLGVQFVTQKDEHIFQKKFSKSTISYFGDHKINKYTLFPAACFLEMAIAVSKIFDPELKKSMKNYIAAVKDLTIFLPLEIYSSEVCTLQTTVFPEINDNTNAQKTFKVEFHSKHLEPSFKTHGWSNHAEAKIIFPEKNLYTQHEINFKALLKKHLILPQTDLYDHLYAVGYNFGPHFQSIKGLSNTFGENRLAEITLKDSNLDDYIIHPLLLDGMFQIARICFVSNINELCLPFAIENFEIVGKPTGQTFYVLANKDSQKMSLYGEDGNILAIMTGVTFIKTTIETLIKNLGHNELPKPEMLLEHWFPKNEYAGKGFFGRTLSVPTIVVNEANAQVYSKEFMDELLKLDPIISTGISLSLNQLCAHDFSVHSVINVKDIIKLNGIKKTYIHTMRRFMEILSEDGYLQASDCPNTFKVIRKFPSIEDATSEIELAFKNRKHLNTIWKFVMFYLKNMCDILSGRLPILRALFPETLTDGSANVVYNEAETFRFSNELLIENLAKILANWNGNGSKIRILEVGAGTASSTKLILALLQQLKIDYVYEFTDISAAFFVNAETKLAQQKKNIIFRVFNVEAEPKGQGFCPHTYDIVIAANVLHATPNLMESVRNIRHLLKSTGWFLLMETFLPQRYYDISWGYLEGFWNYKDFNLRQKSCMISHKQWECLLKTLDFKSIQTSRIFDNRFGVITAQASGNTPLYVYPANAKTDQPWLVFSDGENVCKNLINYLRLAGEIVFTIQMEMKFQRGEIYDISLNPNHKSDFENLFDLLNSARFIPKGIIYGWGLKTSISPNELCRGLLNLTQLVNSTGYQEIPPIYILSLGQAYMGDESVSIPNAAILAGFCRTYRTEFPTAFCKTIDLPNSTHELDLLPQLILQEIWTDRLEPIVAIRNRKQYVAKLQHLIPDAQYPPLIIPKGSFYLNSFNVQYLGDLQFVSHTQNVLKANEVRILVKAAGLNFRDVVTTKKVIAQRTLAVGADFSGIVIEVGNDVLTKKVGDAVIGLNWKNEPLPSHVTAEEDAVVSLPPELSFVEGASFGIPFLTAIHCLVTIGKIQPSDTILIHTASGGVGLFAIQIAKAIGAKVIATAGNCRKRQYLRNIGVIDVFDSRSHEYQKNIEKLTNGKGVNLVLNSLTSKGFKEASLKCCAPNARFIEMSQINIWNDEEIELLRPDVQYFVEDITIFNIEQRKFYTDKLKEFVLLKKINPIPCTQFDSTDIRNALNHFSKPQHIGKIVCIMPNATTIEANSTYVHELFNNRSTYLVTGGLQGVGLAIAHWMSTQGAKHIVVCGRSMPNEKNMKKLQALVESGINLVIKQVDVSIRQDIETLIININNGSLDLPPLKGVMHAAGCLADETISKQTWNNFQKPLQAKVIGGWNLHLLTQNLNLEHFVLFSTFSAIIGGHGQSNHAAANSYLDGLAKYRNSQGLPALSINWGQWGEDGIAANMKIKGVTPFSTLKATNALAYLLRSTYSNVVVSDGDFKTLLEISPWATNYFPKQEIQKQVAQKNERKTLITNDIFWEQFNKADTNTKKKSVIQNVVSDILCDILEIKNRKAFDSFTDLQDMGLDSLMNVQLRNSIQRILNPTYIITLSMLADCTNLQMIAEKIYEIICILPAKSNAVIQMERNELIKNDCLLWEHIKQNKTQSCNNESEIKVVLFTGSTGNLGPYVLEILCRMSQIQKIYCLVRKSDALTAEDRLHYHLKNMQMDVNLNKSKIIVVEGNLIQQFFGMPKTEYDNLASEVHAVINVAVASNHLKEYEMGKPGTGNLRENNVIGTQRVLEFVVAQKSKYLFHASSLVSMCRLNEYGEVNEEFADTKEYEDMSSWGYAISKFVSDRIISQAVIEHGILCKTFRFPLILGEANNGRQMVENNHFFLRYLSYLKTGKIPNLDIPMNFLPVDICASLSLEIFFNQKAKPGMYNIFHPVTRNEKDIVAVAKELGFQVDEVEYDEFLKSVGQKDSLINTYLEFYKDDEKFIKVINMEIFRYLKDSPNPQTFLRSKKILQLIPESYLNVEDQLIYLKRNIQFVQNNYKDII